MTQEQSFVMKVVIMAITTFAAIALTKWAIILAVIYLIVAGKKHADLKKKGTN